MRSFMTFAGNRIGLEKKPRRLRDVAALERLESRALLHGTGFEANINFQKATPAAPARYFIDAGLNVTTTRASLETPGKTYSKTGWEAGIPVHMGIEIGPRRSVFATLSMGYLWVFTGGGDVFGVQSPDGSQFKMSRTEENGLSFGVALGMYLF